MAIHDDAAAAGAPGGAAGRSHARPGSPGGLGRSDEHQGEPAAPAAGSAALSTTPEPVPGALAPTELRQFAAELATQLLQRWQVALREQFRAELGVRLAADLRHREHEARDVAEELTDRRQWQDPVYSAVKRRYGWSGYATWEMDQTLRRQSSQLAETERQMQEIRARLSQLGRAPQGATVIVDAAGAMGGPPGGEAASGTAGQVAADAEDAR